MTSQTFERPDVYFNEVLNPPSPAAGVSLTNGVFVGPHNRGPLEITNVTSYRQFTALYGDFVAGAQPSDLQIAAWLFFNTGGREAWVLRVPDGHEVAASATLLDREPTVAADPLATPPIIGSAPRTTLTVSAKNPGTWGNALSVGITDASDPTRFTLLVFNGTKQVERWADVTMDPADPRYVVAIVNATGRGSQYVTVVDAGLVTGQAVSTADARPAVTGTGTPVALVPVALTGGADATGAPSSGAYDTALAAVDAVSVPVNLNLPGVVDEALINKAISYCSTRGNAFLITDGTTGIEADVASQATQTGLYTNSSYASLPYFPRALVADPAAARPGATRVVAVGGAVMGYYAQNDAAFGVQKAPAGLNARIPNALALEVTLSDTDLATLNQGVANAIRAVPGSGICIMGARTLTTTGQDDKYINVRRSLIYVKAMLKQLTSFALFEDNDYLLWQQLTNVSEHFLMQFWQNRGLSGDTASQAFYVICDETNNTESDIEQGIVNVEIGLALQRPAEFVVITLSQFQGSGTTSITEDTALAA
jgi:uncharacterized protein